MNKIFRIFAYIISVALFSFYVLMLFRCINPKTTADYKMRYLDEGYFWEDRGEWVLFRFGLTI